MDLRNLFKDKKITVMGLGLLGRGVGDVRFLAENGAELVVTDLKPAEKLESSLDLLREFTNITYVLGEHRLEDFRNRDFILKGADVPVDSPYLEEARKHHVPIEMSTSLFAKLTPATLIGITGTRGKSTTTQLVYEILSAAHKGTDTRVFLGGNVRGVATLPFLKETKTGDIAVLELDSWQLWGFGQAEISPPIGVFTTFFPDHQNYYKNDMDRYLDDKANIFKYQTSGDVLILGKQAASVVRSNYPGIKSRVIVSPPFPALWRLSLPGEHNRDNAALAIEAARQYGVPEDTIHSAVASFKGVSGRLEKIAEIEGISFYNDTTATTPDAVIAGLRALGKSNNIILIMGGADKQLSMAELLPEIPRFCKAVVVLPGTGTERIKHELQSLEADSLPFVHVGSMNEAVTEARRVASSGDMVLLSPGFASFGLFQNEFHRGEEFVREVNALMRPERE